MKTLLLVLGGLGCFLLGAAAVILVICWECWQKVKHNDIGRSD